MPANIDDKSHSRHFLHMHTANNYIKLQNYRTRIQLLNPSSVVCQYAASKSEAHVGGDLSRVFTVCNVEQFGL